MSTTRRQPKCNDGSGARSVAVQGDNYGPITTGNNSPIHITMWRGGPRQWAEGLAREVEASESKEWRRLLGGDNKRIDLNYTLFSEGGRSAKNTHAVGHLADSSINEPDICSYFEQLHPRRLVITGMAGAGKTVLALELLLALIERRSPDDPVPVRLSMAAWNTDIQLADYLVSYLDKAYDVPKRRARRLVDEGWILPVLDGLDEMDQPLNSGRPNPKAPRAKAALAILNKYQVGRYAGPVVITAREEAYQALGRGNGNERSRRLIDAARVSIAPVSPDVACAYLVERSAQEDRWSGFINYLEKNPNSEISKILSTPWRLCLIASVYDSSGTPSELIDLKPSSKLDLHLLARYIPAQASLLPNHRYDAANVHRWLHRLAGYIDKSGRSSEPVGVIELGSLWKLAGVKTVFNLRVDVYASPLLAGIVMLLGGFKTVGIFLCLVALFAYITGKMTLHDLGARSLRLPSISGLLKSNFGRFLLLTDIGVPIAVGLLTGKAVLAMGVLSGCIATTIGGLYVSPSATAISPRARIRDDAAASVAAMLAALPAFAIFTWSDFHSMQGRLLASLYVSAWATISTMGGLWQNYACLRLIQGRIFPPRLGKFLDWCVDAGLLRRTGASYQFRHQAIQDYLVHNPEPLPVESAEA